MDAQGQVSMELVFLTGFIIVLMMGITSYLGEDIELNQAMAAARSGAAESANINSFAIYPSGRRDDPFYRYYRETPWLLNPQSIEIVRVDYKNLGIHPRHNKTWIQFRVVASSPFMKRHPIGHDPLGDRINFYVRKSISESFGTSGQTNVFHNPSFSNRYVFTTRGVKWI